MIIGGAIEAGANYCTHRLDEKLRSMGIRATFDYENAGTHSWPYWGRPIAEELAHPRGRFGAVAYYQRERWIAPNISGWGTGGQRPMG